MDLYDQFVEIERMIQDGKFDIKLSQKDKEIGFSHLTHSLSASPSRDHPITNGNSPNVKHLLEQHGSLVESISKTSDVDTMILNIFLRKTSR